MSKPFDLFAEFAKFSAKNGVRLDAPEATSAFTTHAKEALDQALTDQILVHGHRTEAMFEAMLLSLGEFNILKPEDIGRVYPEDLYAVPDFRVVLKDGRQWLIEVKNVYIEDPYNQARVIMNQEYLERLEAYAAATGAELKLAVFWARWSVWTLVTPSKFVNANGTLSLNMLTSVKANEFGELGDRTIGTKPPLRFRLNANKQMPRAVDPEGNAKFTIGAVQMFCGDNEILNETEREIAWTFMLHGEWEEQEPEAIFVDGDLSAIEHSWHPIDRGEEEFELIGSLSRMFARYYAWKTFSEKEVVQIHAPLRPDWFSPLVSPEYKSDKLPIWNFRLQPSYDSA